MSTSTVNYSAEWDPCIRKASMLILDVYDYASGDLPPELRPHLASNNADWDRVDEVGSRTSLGVQGAMDAGDTGLYGAFYIPKKGGDNSCPPVLAFRGSETNDEDFRDLAVNIEATMTITGSGLGAIAEWSTDDSIELDIPTISLDKRYNGTASRADMRAVMKEQPLVPTTTGRETIALSLPLFGSAGRIHLDWEASAHVFYGEMGDWSTNVAQGMGAVPQAYKEAITFAKACAKIAQDEWDGRLIVTGHSLGGGLASAAAVAIRAANPKLKLACKTYNAAGLHENTAAHARATLTTAAEIPVVTNCVSGCILTALQTPNLVPLIAPVFRWGKNSMPPAAVNPSPVTGISAGNHAAKKWDRLPVLFPLDKQTAWDQEFTVLKKIFDAAAISGDFSGFVSRFINILFQELGDEDGAIRGHELYKIYSGYSEMDFSTVGPQIAKAIGENGPVPTITLSSNSSFTQNRLQPFIQNMLTDVVGIGRIFHFAVAYHMFDTCAFTFLLERNRGK